MWQNAVGQSVLPYKNPSLSVDIRVKDLLDRMTLEEKVGQVSVLTGWEMYEKQGDKISVSEKFKKAIEERHTGMFWATLRADPWTKKTLKTGLNPEQSVRMTNLLQRYVLQKTRLGIPLFFAEECAHGHMAIGTTVFPTSIGQSSTWNTTLIKEMAGAIAEEARLQGAHIGYGPVLDLAREPRWSRVEETYGEDPVLNSRMGAAMIQGFQGTDLKSGKNVISTLKHFAAYGISEGGHNGGSVTVGQRELCQSYLLPFEAGINAGALSVMTAYNSVDGIPCSANPVLINGMLKEKWHFKGFVVSDLGSISGLASTHRVVKNATEAAAVAMNAGLDADLSGYGFGGSLIDAVNEGKVSRSVLDSAVARILKLKFEMGLFEQPYVDINRVKKGVRSESHIRLAREVARESIILLKNEQQLLPLKKNVKSIAVIGPNADNIYNQLGDYTAPQQADNVVTVLEGIKAKVSANTRVTYVRGCAIRDTSNVNIGEAVEAARHADVAVVVLGGSSARDFKTEYEETGAARVSSSAKVISDIESGEGFDRSSLDLMGKQLDLLKAVVQTGKPVVLILIMGRPLNLNWAAAHVPAIVNAWYPGQEGGNGIAEVLFGDYNPGGRLPVSVPKSVGQLPVYYNFKRPLPGSYVEEDAQPLYPFGYGLSYTSFSYDNLRLTSSGRGQGVTVEFDVKNSGRRAGDEVVQLYLRDEVSSVVTPFKQLKRFARISLGAGESRHVRFDLSKEDLQLLNAEMQWVVEPGEFAIMVGASSADIRLSGTITIPSV